MDNQPTLHITKLSQDCVNFLIPTFDQLPHTKHADGKFRLKIFCHQYA